MNETCQDKWQHFKSLKYHDHNALAWTAWIDRCTKWRWNTEMMESLRGIQKQKNKTNSKHVCVNLERELSEIDYTLEYLGDEPNIPLLCKTSPMISTNTKHLHNICTLLDQRLRRLSNSVQMLYRCVVFCWENKGHRRTCHLRKVPDTLFLLRAHQSGDPSWPNADLILAYCIRCWRNNKSTP